LNEHKYHMITCEKNWLESTALSQLQAVAKLPGVLRTVGLPDLHAGKSPVGMALETQDIIYPHLIGGDIGCGMGLFDTGLDIGKYSEKRWLSRLNHIPALADIATVNPYPEPSPISDLGTLGSGNHFAEFQQIETVFSPEDFAELNLPQKNIILLVHSGSRGYGQEVFKSLNYVVGMKPNSPEAIAYLQKHDIALLWARRNRALVSDKLIGWLGYEATPRLLIDLFHNYLEKRDDTWIHLCPLGAKCGINRSPQSAHEQKAGVKPTVRPHCRHEPKKRRWCYPAALVGAYPFGAWESCPCV